MVLRFALAAAALALLTPAVAVALPAGSTTLIGAAAPGSSTPLPTPVGASDTEPGSVSQDGRYVAFSSRSPALAAEADDLVENVFVKDRSTGAVELVSRATGPDGAPNAERCHEATISDDGQRVAFVCGGALDPADTNSSSDVYLRDRTTQTTVLISRAAAVGSGSSDDPEISGDGAYVAFASYATNLVVGSPSGSHIFRRLVGGTNQVVRVDVPNGPGQAASAFRPSISDDGQRVAFDSASTNLAPGTTDTNGFPDVFVRSMTTNVTTLASAVNANAAQASAGASTDAALSGNGAFVAFKGSASNFGDGDTDTSDDIHRRTLVSSSVVLVSRAAGPSGAESSGVQYRPSVDDSGDAVSFVSTATNLGTSPAGARQLYVRRVGAATIELASRRSGSGAVGSLDTESGALSGDGGTVAVDSPGLSDDADPNVSAVFARDLVAAARPTTLVSRPPGDAPFENLGADVQLERGALSADGRYTVFASAARGLPGHPGDRLAQIWRRDALTGGVVLVSRADGADGAAANASSYDATISADGTRVAYATSATNLGAGAGAVVVRDLVTQATIVASRVSGAGGGTVFAGDPTISGDGRRVAFVSSDPALGASGGKHLYVRDLEAATTAAVAAAQVGTAAGPRLDGTGSRVAWQLTTPGKGKESGEEHVWAADVAGGTPTPLDAGAAAGENSREVSISADGARVAFVSQGPLVAADTNDDTDVYVSDRASGTLTVASVASGGAQADGGSYEAEISGDGRRVAFLSDAALLTPEDPDEVTDAFVRDLDAGTTTLVSRADGLAGAKTTIDVRAVAIDATGGCVVFETADTTLAPGLTPTYDRAWLRAVRDGCPAGGQVPGAGAGGPAVTPRVLAPAPRRPLVSKLLARPSRFSTRGRRPGTTLSFTLDRAASVRVVVARVGRGHRVGKACRARAPRRGTKQKPCTTLRTLTTISRTGKPGTNRVAFTGRVKGKRLAKGSYRASVVATANGLRSVARTVMLTIR